MRIKVKVQPNARHNQIVGFTAGVLKLRIAAPPDKGKANKELIDFLSNILDVQKERITIVKGETAHNKLVAFKDINQESVFVILESLCKKNS